MGIIQNQSIKGSLFIYIGVIIGMLNTAILYPKMLTPSEVGLTGLLLTYSGLYSKFAALGLQSVITRMFSYFRDYENNHNGFVFIMTVVSLIGFVLFVILFLVFKQKIIADNIEKSALLVDYLFYIIPLTFFALMFIVLDDYYKVLYNATIGIYMEEFWMRIFKSVAILLFYFRIIDFPSFIFAFAVAASLPSVILAVKLILIGQLNFKPNLGFISKKLRKELISVGFFGIISSLSGVINVGIDKIMVNHFLGIGKTGVYTIAFFFGTLILIPSRTLTKIASAIIADAWKNEDHETVDRIYSKSSLNLFIISCLLFIGIWGNIHNIFKVLPEAYQSGRFVIFYIALSGVVQMATGVSRKLLYTSKYYALATYFFVFYAVILVITMYIFIPPYGIEGAALATLISTFIYAVLRYVFIYVKFKFQPYDYKYLIIAAITVGTYLLSEALPVLKSFLFDTIMRSLLMTVVFSSLVLLLKVSDEANDIFKRSLNKVLVFIRKDN